MNKFGSNNSICTGTSIYTQLTNFG